MATRTDLFSEKQEDADLLVKRVLSAVDPTPTDVEVTGTIWVNTTAMTGWWALGQTAGPNTTWVDLSTLV